MGEKRRILAMSELMKVPAGIVSLLAFNSEFVVEKGVFHDWNFQIFLYCVVPSGLLGVYSQLLIIVCGTLKANLAQNFEIASVYIMEVVILGTQDFSVPTMATLVGLAGALVAYSIISIEVREGELKGKMQII